MNARDVMTRNVRTVSLTTPVRKIAQTLVAHRISAVPVVDKKRHVIGIVSESDLFRRTEAGTAQRRNWWRDLLCDPTTKAREFVKSQGAQARDVMTQPVICAGLATNVGELASLMEKWDVKRVPIVQSGKLVGIVSRSDLVKAVARAKPAARIKVSDQELRTRLQGRLDAETWAPRALVNFVVDKGKVELFGLVGSQAQRNAIRVLAESTPGVRSVHDQLTLEARVGYYA
jgi:CBS domain-containing protein